MTNKHQDCYDCPFAEIKILSVPFERLLLIRSIEKAGTVIGMCKLFVMGEEE